MAYTDTYLLSTEEQLIQRLAVSVAKTSWYISSEDPNTANHDRRMALVAYAGPRNADYLRFARECTIYLLTQNESVDIDSTDAELDTALAGIWNGYAAVLEAKGSITVEEAV